MSKLYIAYGSNLHIPQMKRRCPDSEVVGSSVIRDYCITFRGNSHTGVMNIEPCRYSTVPVVIWKISDWDENNLDIYEGYPHLYKKQNFEVEINGRIVTAMAYVMTPGHTFAPPNEYYLGICADGYDYFGFDTDPLYYASKVAMRYDGYDEEPKPVIEFESRGESGNVFWLLGAVSRALRREQRISDYNTCRDQVTASHSYEEALSHISRYVTLVDTSD